MITFYGFTHRFKCKTSFVTGHRWPFFELYHTFFLRLNLSSSSLGAIHVLLSKSLGIPQFIRSLRSVTSRRKEASEEISSEDAVASSHWWRMAHNARTKCRRHEFIYQINKGDKRKTYIYWLSGCPGGDAKLVTLTTSHRHKEKKNQSIRKKLFT